MLGLEACVLLSVPQVSARSIKCRAFEAHVPVHAGAVYWKFYAVVFCVFRCSFYSSNWVWYWWSYKPVSYM